jgi:uncharacterized protein (TIGR03067 family)
MRYYVSLLGLLLLAQVVGADMPREFDARMKREGLTGTWLLVSAKADGMENLGMNEHVVLVIEGDRWSLKDGDTAPQVGTIRINATVRPAHLDYIQAKGPAQIVPDKMIYQLDGDTLKIGLIFQLNFLGAAPQPKRPDSFDQQDVLILIFKRAK